MRKVFLFLALALLPSVVFGADVLLHDNSTGAAVTQAEFEHESLHRISNGVLGDVVYSDSSRRLARLAVGSAGQVLVVSGGLPSWASLDDQYIELGDTFVGDVGGTYDATVIQADAVEETMLKAVDEAADEDYLTYEDTTGDFEWKPGSEIATVGTITVGVWTGTALGANYVPGHNSLNGYDAYEHIDWTDATSTLNQSIVLDRDDDLFTGMTLEDGETPYATFGLSADANNDFEIKALAGSDMFLLNADSDGISLIDTGTDPQILFDLGDAVELLTFAGDAARPTITSAGAGPLFILGDAAGVTTFAVADSGSVVKASINSDGLLGIAGAHNAGAGIYVNSLGTVPNAIDLSAAGVSTSSDYWIYMAAGYGWRADGRLYTPYLSITTGPISSNSYQTYAQTANMTFKVTDTDGSAFLFTDSDEATLVSIDADDGNTIIGGTLTPTGALLPLGAITGDGGGALSGMLDVVTNDADGMAQGVLTAANVGMLITNAAAGGAMAYVLPEASTCIGGTFYFAVMAAQPLRVDPYDATDQILLLTGTAGDYYWADAIGETLTIKAVAADGWVVMHSTGTWTEE